MNSLSEAFAPKAEARPTGRAVSKQVIGTDRLMSAPTCARQGRPHGKTEGGIVLAVICWPQARRGGCGVTRQSVVLTDLQPLVGCP